MGKNKAQGGVNAAILVTIIAGLIILYIIFLPASEREKLVLNEQEKGKDSNAGSPNVLLKASPGTLSASENLENEKKIPNIFLIETTNAKELERINPFIVRSGWFDKKTHKFDFSIDDLENTDNLVLTFSAKERQGALAITLNNALIYENELRGDNPEPIKLDKKLLSKANSLEFSVSSVGYRFWMTNEYSFDSMKIIGDITDTSKQESTNIFTMSDSEISSMGKAVLKFVPYCKSISDIGKLDIFLNNRKLFSSIPICDNAYKQDIPKAVLNEGENNIVFKTNKGSYSVEQIKVSLDLKEPKVKTYYFEISPALFKQVRSGKNIMLNIRFVEAQKQKRLNLDVNGHIESIETDKAAFSKSINSKVLEGNNFVRLVPLADVEVAELTIESQ